MKLLKYIVALYLVCQAAACKDYLDVTPDNVATLDYAFRNRNETENYLFTCYSTLQNMADVVANPAFTTSGEIYFPNTLTEATLGGRGNEVGFHLIRGTQTTDQPALNYWDGENLGQPLFKAIRRCNILLENIDKPADLTPAEKNRWIAETKFLKAYYHFYLLRMYGPIPLIKENLPINATTEEVRVHRSSMDESFDYIVSLLDEAIPALPAKIQNPTQELGRITKTIALAVKAEVMVTRASPLFNGNPDYSGITGKDGKILFPANYDETKWNDALVACDSAIRACDALGLHLYKFIAPGNLPSLPTALKQVMDLRTTITEKWELNSEIIWALNPTFGYQHMSMPRLTSEMVQNMGGAPGNFAVPLSMAELFYTDHGLPMNEDKTYDFRNRYELTEVPESEKYLLHAGYQTVKMHLGREPRFYADLSFDGSNFFGNGVTNPEAMLYVQARGSNSIAGPKDNIRVNVTGYWPSKLVNYLSVFGTEVTGENFRLPIIRLAGLYLLYAEALNEVGGPTAEVMKYVDLVRERAGIPGLANAYNQYASNPGKINSKEGMREVIHRERRLELCFEGGIGWDLRRWKSMQQVLSNPIQGWSIQETDPSGYYRARTLAIPVFGLKDYLWPIKNDALIINPNLVQNPYW